MHKFRTAIRACGRKGVLFSFLLPLLILFHSESAFSASLTVAVRQVNPDGALQQITCAVHQANCVVPVALNGGQISLTVHVEYAPGNLLLEFQSPTGYYYANETVDTVGLYRTIWGKAVPGVQPATYHVTLFQPLVSHMEAPILSVAQEAAKSITHAVVVNLQITTTPGP